MATWQDGPEYAPLVRPVAFEPPEQPTAAPPESGDTSTQAAGGEPARVRTARAPHVRPGFTAPESVPLDAVSSGSPDRRDPHEPFDVVARTARSGSAWPAAHAAHPQPGPTPYEPEPVSAPFDPSAPPPYVPAPYVPAPPADGSGVDARERSARWLLLPGALYLLGACTGPLMTLAMLLASLLLAGRGGVRTAAKALSRIVLIVLSSVTLLAMVAGEGLAGVTAVARGVGLVYVALCGMWFVRERSEIDAERHRRSEQSAVWPPPQDRG